MADQTTEQNNQANAAATQPVSQYSSAVEPPVIAVSPEPYVAPAIAGEGTGVPGGPTVVVSGNSGGVPKWFYLVFGITLIVFFAVTTLLVLSLTKKQSSTLPLSSDNVAPIVSSPTEVILPPSPLPPQATDSAGLIQSGGSNDDIESLENEVNSTDLSALDNDLSTIDNELSAP